MRHYERNVYPGENEKDLSALLLSKGRKKYRQEKEKRNTRQTNWDTSTQHRTPNAETEEKLSTGVVWTQEQD